MWRLFSKRPLSSRLEFSDFQVDHDEAVEPAVVEEQVDLVVAAVEDEMLLPGQEREVAAHLQNEFLKLGENRVLQVLLAIGVLQS